MCEFKDFYNKKNIFVTGHTGFKGSWLSIWLHTMGANVIGYSDKVLYENSNFELSKLGEKIIDLRGDICNKEKLLDAFEQTKPEIVFHLAAQPIVLKSYKEPINTYYTNVIGTLTLLECAKQCESVKEIIIVTSDKCYENKEWVWGYRESDSLGGYDPYSCSKACVELLVNSYRNSYFNVNTFSDHKKSVATARAGNVIGGGDWCENRIIPDIIKSVEQNKIIELRNPKAIRPWQHVLEALSGYLVLGKKLSENPIKYSEPFNFGPEFEDITTVEYIVEKTLKYYGTGTWKDISNTKEFHEANLLMLDITKSKNKLGWNPKWNLDKAIEKTVEWYKNYKTQDVYEICKNQIEEYQNI